MVAHWAPQLFLSYVNDVWKSSESTIRFSSYDCTIYRSNHGWQKLRNVTDVSWPNGGRALKNEMKINPGKSKAVQVR
jgi:hypothetical protein